MSIQILRLTTGEELIGEVSVDDDGGYVIECPSMIGMMQSDTGEPNMAIQQYLPHSEDGAEVKIRISSSHVVFSFTPLDEIVNHYKAARAGLVVAPKGKGIV